ncbi:MAG: preprotein translocase subunit SecA [bacterium]|nr:preprotein translocase subunit SecA [bacterium]
MANFLTSIAGILGSHNERVVRKILPTVEEINKVFNTLHTLTDEELQHKTIEFRERIKAGETVDDLLPEAYAVVKDACRRLVGRRWMVTDREWEWNMVPFDVQLIGAIVLHQGKISEMATGEGKTLVATMPLYLNSLTGNGCHLVTVNDYLANRDSQWMGGVFNFLGVSVGCIQNGMTEAERKPHYDCDITYGTNNEFGFDYLRDNMVWSFDKKVQRGHNYAIVDEVDSVLIDEARTPLIISGAVEHVINREYARLKPTVERMVHKQTLFCNQLVAEAEKLLSEDKDEEAGKKLFIVQKGSPKNNRLMKLKKEGKVLKLLEVTEKKLIGSELAQKTSIKKEETELHKLEEQLFYTIDEKGNAVNITEKGRETISPGNPDFFTLPDLFYELPAIDKNQGLSPREKFVAKQAMERSYAEKSESLHAINQLLKAYSLFEKDVDYVTQENKVIIVDEFTGRLMPGRRYSDGLHQALEAKEGVRVESETQTFATITLQNYFKMYEKLAGMTGTAMTEAKEFFDIYKLEVINIPTNRPIRRIEYQDAIYKTRREKYDAIIKEVEEMHKLGRPVLLGTTSVDVSETLSRMLNRKGIAHQVLNAKQHQREAEVVSLAGQKGRVTIATNMAGRGTDIKLTDDVIHCQRCCIGCSDDCSKCPTGTKKEKCAEALPCGLHIIGSERHEARRIDRQLKGRCARQGDPGSSKFYLSLEDNLMRLFGSDRIAGAMDRWGPKENEPIEHKLITRAIEGAQKRVEMWNFDIRKHALEYDNVLNYQRDATYGLRDEILEGKDLSEKAKERIDEAINTIIDTCIEGDNPEKWDWEGFTRELRTTFMFDFRISEEEKLQIDKKELKEKLTDAILNLYAMREQQIGADTMRDLEKQVMLHVIDKNWRDHLYELDALKEGIGLRGYAQRDPLIEYKREAFQYFDEFLSNVNKETVRNLFALRLRTEAEQKADENAQLQAKAVKEEVATMNAANAQAPTPAIVERPRNMGGGFPGMLGRHYEAPQEQPTVATFKRNDDRVGRNDPCPCGSGKKYKNCCGKV